jgi:hypothetical protein
MKKKSLRLPDDAPITFSLTGTSRGGGPLALNIKKNKKKLKEIAPGRERTDEFFSDGDRSGRGAARDQN